MCFLLFIIRFVTKIQFCRLHIIERERESSILEFRSLESPGLLLRLIYIVS